MYDPIQSNPIPSGGSPYMTYILFTESAAVTSVLLNTTYALFDVFIIKFRSRLRVDGVLETLPNALF